MVRAAAVLLAALAALAVTARAGAAGSPLSVQARLSPAAAGFGEAVRAIVDVRLDPARVDPDSVALRGRFRPYLPDGPVRRSSAGSGRLRLEVPLRCLRPSCLPRSEGATRAFRFAPSAVTYRAAGQERSAAAPWPTLHVRSLLTPADRLKPRFRIRLRPLPAFGYGVSPGRAKWLVLGGAALCAFGALACLALAVRRRGAPAARRVSRLGPLERALAIVRHAAAAGPPRERRLALDRLARVLRGQVAGGLPDEAAQLAWSPDRPAPAALETLADRVERRGGDSA